MELKLSNERYKRDGVVYQEVYVNYPVYVFDTDMFGKVEGTLLYDGETILAIPSYIFENFKKLEA